ncbi:dihydroorotase [Tissierella sp.]|uniref:dihydroorotase n=1 Tax=Tissierella sp. TaxID=41274 RepID=UPI0028593D73|nr:dihydroorotase [Tissierella sp.]MDR7856609.1 dihydroorotase [Tissierella sp.]
MDILIKSARIVDESKDFIGDVYVKDGLIEDFGENLEVNCKTINGEGLVLMPSFIDLHVHFREPGYTHKEDLYTGGLAALKGGYTLVNLMGNTNPICSSMETVDYVLNRARDLDLVDVHQTVSITKDFDGQTLEHLDSLDNKVKFISDDGKGVKSNITMYNAMVIAKEKGLIIMTHAEDDDLTPIDYRISENIITIRDIYLSKVTGARLHLSHVSTIEAIEEIRRAKLEGVNLTCEVTPHHIALWDNDYKVNPPIRTKTDVEGIIKGIIDGTVDTIATDHAPHSIEDKENGAPGLSGIETAFPVSYTRLVRGGRIDLSKLSKIMSANAGKIMGVKKGKIEKGYYGDIVLVDLNKEITIDGNKFLSKGKNTPFNGMKFYGEVVMTLKDGEIKYINKKFIGGK